MKTTPKTRRPNADDGACFSFNEPRAYDLEERTARFGESVIESCLKLPDAAVLHPLISQFVRPATSTGANYCAANDAESKKDFRHKIALCRKEVHETKYWCMLAKVADDERDTTRALWTEARELNLIFPAIFRKTKTD